MPKWLKDRNSNFNLARAGVSGTARGAITSRLGKWGASIDKTISSSLIWERTQLILNNYWLYYSTLTLNRSYRYQSIGMKDRERKRYFSRCFQASLVKCSIQVTLTHSWISFWCSLLINRSIGFWNSKWRVDRVLNKESMRISLLVSKTPNTAHSVPILNPVLERKACIVSAFVHPYSNTSACTRLWRARYRNWKTKISAKMSNYSKHTRILTWHPSHPRSETMTSIPWPVATQDRISSGHCNRRKTTLQNSSTIHPCCSPGRQRFTGVQTRPISIHFLDSISNRAIPNILEINSSTPRSIFNPT